VCIHVRAYTCAVFIIYLYADIYVCIYINLELCNEGIRAISATTAADVVGRRFLSFSLFFLSFSLSLSLSLADNYYHIYQDCRCVHLQVRSRVCRIYSVDLFAASSLLATDLDLYYSDDGGSQTPIKMHQGQLPQGRPRSSSRNSCILN